jgi:hypothetical protein
MKRDMTHRLVRGAGLDSPWVVTSPALFHDGIRIFAPVVVYPHGALFGIQPGAARQGVNEMNPDCSPAHERAATLAFDKEPASKLWMAAFVS